MYAERPVLSPIVAGATWVHSGTLTIVDKNHIEMNGEGWENGKPAQEMCGKMKLVRKK